MLRSRTGTLQFTSIPRARAQGCVALVVFSLLSVLLPGCASAASGGALDGSFGGDGIALLPGSGTRLLGAAVQPDGKLVAVGSRAGSLLVVRFDADGSLDGSFAGGGYVGPGTTARGVAIQPDGRIVVAGTSGAGMLAVRLNTNGSPDTSFSGDGVSTALPGRSAEGRAIALDAGKIVVAGTATGADAYPRPAVARLNADGSPDSGFGSGGAAVFDLGRLSYANAVGVQSDGRIVIAGSQRNDLQTTSVLAARLTGGGALDSSFHGNGLFLQQYARSAAYSAVFDLALAPDGKIVLAGSATNGLSLSDSPEGVDAIAIRLNANGNPDSSFDGDGVAYLPASTRKDQYNQTEPLPGAQGVVLGGSDVILGGYYDETTLKRLAVWALDSSGAPDLSFGSGGHTFTPFGNDSAELNALSIAANGDIFGAGDLGSGLASPPTGLAAKYGGVGAPPTGAPPTGGPPPGNPPPAVILHLGARFKGHYALGPALRQGIRLNVGCNRACSVRIKLMGLGTVLARGKGKLNGAGRKVLRVRFTKAGRRKLESRARVTARLIVIANGGGNRFQLGHNAVLKRERQY